MARERINIKPSSGTSRFAPQLLEATLSGARTITPAELDAFHFFRFDPGGSNRDVTLPAVGSSGGALIFIKNTADAAETLVIKNAAAAAVMTISQDEAAFLWCDGTNWDGGSLPELVGVVVAGEIALAEGSVLQGNSSGVAAALAAGTSGQILVGDGTDLASVVVSGDVTLSSAGAVALAADTVTGDEIANVANVNAIAGVAVVHRIAVPSGANGDVDITVTHKIRVVDAVVVLKGDGTGGCSVTIKSTANAISDAIDVAAGGDRDIFRPAEIDDANQEIAAAGILRVSKASTGGDFPGAEVTVIGYLTA